MHQIYLDHHATTPVDPLVLERMLPYFKEKFGNSSSASHRFGWEATRAVERARAQVALLIGARPTEILFTSGSTEAVNLAIQGVTSFAEWEGRNHVVTQATEHSAVLDTVAALERRGTQVTRLGVDSVGRIRLEELERVLDETTALVAIMAVNNEIGTIQPVAEIASRCRAVGAKFFCDATQAVGWQSFDVRVLGVDLACLSAHKIYGPKGAGALFVRDRESGGELEPVLFGGGQEKGLRPGTLNVPSIVGLGEACELASERGEADAAAMKSLRDELHRLITERVAGIHVNGCPTDRHPGNLHLSVEGVSGDELAGSLQEIAFSAGSACTSASAGPSHVVLALGCTERLGMSSVRFGLGRSTTEEEVQYVAQRLGETLGRLRRTNPAGRGPTAQLAATS